MIIKIMNRLGITMLLLAAFISFNSCCQNFFWSHTGALPVDTCSGYLYNHYAAIDPLLVSSVEWGVPDRDACRDMAEVVEPGFNNTTNVIGKRTKAVGLTYWTTSDGEGLYNLNIIGAGIRNYTDGTFDSKKDLTRIWRSEIHSTSGNGFLLDYQSNSDIVTMPSQFGDGTTGNSIDRKEGATIRLVRAATAPELLLDDGTYTVDYTGNDGKTYSAVKIGAYVWMAENLEETEYNDSSSIPNVTDNDAWKVLVTGAWCLYNNDSSTACK